MRSLLFARATSWVGPVLVSLVTSRVLVFWSMLVVALGCAPDADDPLSETEGSGAKSSSEAPIRDGRRHWLSLVCLSLLDPWSHVVRLHQLGHGLFFRQR